MRGLMWTALLAAGALAACGPAGPARPDPGAAHAPMAAEENRRFAHETETTAAAEALWARWMDVGSWKTWDLGLKDAALDGAMGRGATGTITPLSGPPASFTVSEFDEGRSYAFVTQMPGATLTVRRTIVRAGPPLRFRHEVFFDGPLAGFWADRFGPSFRTALPPTMERLATLAEGDAQ